MLYLCLVIIVIAGGAFLFLQKTEFGRLPSGARLERIKKSPHYHDGEFRNQISTPNLVEGTNFFTIMWDYWFVKKERLSPEQPLPHVKTDLLSLPEDSNTMIWFGHSSFLMRLGGLNILVDPVFSPHASPVSFSTKAFPGTTSYQADDMPPVDYLLISHDHWDHLDYPTVAALKGRVKKIICPLGVGEHFERWGYGADSIIEADCYEIINLEPNLKITFWPARHFSGRTLTRNKTLWTAYVLEAGGQHIFYSGDTGYGPHFKEAAERFGGFDLAVIENGQYDDKWPFIHMRPEQTAQAAEDLRAKAMMPVHSGKFCISNHPWDEPLSRLALDSADKNYELVTPMIGQPFEIGKPGQNFPRWWEGFK